MLLTRILYGCLIGLVIGPSTDITESTEEVASINLLESLFMSDGVVNRSLVDSVGLVFTAFERPVLFPLANGSCSRIEIRSSVIGALVAGQTNISNLTHPIVTVTLPLNINNSVSLHARVSVYMCVCVWM